MGRGYGGFKSRKELLLEKIFGSQVLYESKNYISKGTEIEVIGETAEYVDEPEEQGLTIFDAEIVGVQQLERHRRCLRCKARVEPLESGLGRCSKEECQMLQRYDVYRSMP